MEAATAPRLKLVDPTTGELVDRDPDSRIRDLEDLNAGLRVTVDKQAREIGTLKRKLTADDPEVHPQRAAIHKLIDRWREACNHPKAKAGTARVKLVAARIKDGYPVTSEEWLPSEPTLELAIDGLAAYPYRVFNRRYAEGKPADRDDDLTAALKDEKHVELCARLGYKARQAGWTLEGGWPA